LALESLLVIPSEPVLTFLGFNKKDEDCWTCVRDPSATELDRPAIREWVNRNVERVIMAHLHLVFEIDRGGSAKGTIASSNGIMHGIVHDALNRLLEQNRVVVVDHEWSVSRLERQHYQSPE